MSQKYEVVISGVSGRFPETENVTQLSEKLFDSVNLVTSDSCKWTPGSLDVPVATGKIQNVMQFDSTYFGIHRKLRELMDHHICLCMTSSFEAICDAGISPLSMSGTNTAVFMNSSLSESEYGALMKGTTGGHGMLGHSRTMQANRISFSLNLKGPSCAIDSTWCGGFEGLTLARRLISEGYINAALVGGSNIHLFPQVSFHYDRMGRLTHGDKTKSFSDDADGYNRSEACVVLFLQRAEDAKRSYGTVVDVLVRNFGSRTGTFADLTEKHYKQLLKDIYNRSGVSPSDIGYVELDGCANKKVDAAELNSVDEVLCSERKDPLLIGSVKSNLGHTEAASSLVSLVKALIALDSGIIPPNLHYTEPNAKATGLVGGNLQVVTTPTPLPKNLVAVSTIGLCGTYAHAILKQNPKFKSNIPTVNKLPPDGLPRLVVMSGRDLEDMKHTFLRMKRMPIDEEFVALTHNVFKQNIPKHLYRGYTILDENNTDNIVVQDYSSGDKRPVWFIFSGMGSQWPAMGASLMKLPVFFKSIQKCQSALEPKGIDVIDIITNPNPSIFNSILYSFVGIAAIQIGLVDVLAELGVEPDGILGHSVGELGCAYADGCITAEQMILSAYARGKASIETNLIKGKMAAIGLGYEEMRDKIPPGIEVACHNSNQNCTLSGPEAIMEEYIAELKSQGIFAKLVNVANIAYHSKLIQPAAPILLKYLKEVIPEPKKRLSRWISSSVPEANWSDELAQYSSAEYHTNNLLSPVLFHEASTHIPENAIVIEIAPHGLLQAILRKSHGSCVNVSLTNRSELNGIQYLLNSVGRLYVEGIDVNIASIYPKVEFPVSRNTAPIHDLLTWNQPESVDFFLSKKLESPFTNLVAYDQDSLETFTECKIFDNVFIPRAALINSLIEVFTQNKEKEKENVPISLEYVKFIKDIEHEGNFEPILCQIPKGAGEFEMSRDHNAILTGKICFEENNDYKFYNLDAIDMGLTVKTWTNSEFYKYLKSMGVEYGNKFRNVKELTAAENGFMVKVTWKEDWFLFIDALFQIVTFVSTSTQNKLELVSFIGSAIIDCTKFSVENTDINVYYITSMQMLCCKGLQFNRVQTKEISTMESTNITIKYENLKFVPFNNCNIQDLDEFLSMCGQLILENITGSEILPTKINIIQFGKQDRLSKSVEGSLLQKGNTKVKIVEINEGEKIYNDKINELAKECCLIIAGELNSEDSKTLLQRAKEGFILSSKNSNTLSYGCETTLTFQYNKPTVNLYFHKKVQALSEKISIVHASKENYETELLSSLNDQEFERGQVYVVKKYDSETTIHKTLIKCNQIANGQQLRFIFINSECPEFALNHPFYTSQMAKDLKVNAYKDGTWGSLRTFLYPGEKNVNKDDILQLTELKSCETNMKYLAIKLHDDWKMSSFEKKLGILEYSGCNKKGLNIFGLCSIIQKNTLLEDPILCWHKPKDWSQEQATSVPLNYCLAIYVLEIIGKIKAEASILVHDGTSFISQAAINTALKIGCKIFITYKNENEKNKLQILFPQIGEENIFTLNNHLYAYNIFKMTGGKGVKFVLNTLECRRHFLTSIRCISLRGTFCQVNANMLNDNYKLGMSYFTKETQFIGCNPDCLLNLSDTNKRILHDTFKRYLDEGVIKPFSFKVISGPLSSLQAQSLLMSEEMNDKRLVLKMSSGKNENNNQLYLCRPREAYIIVGDQGEYWIDIALWLIMRGAVYIFVGTFENLSTAGTHRLNCLKAKHPEVQITLLKLKNVDTELKVENMLQTINSQFPIAAVFILEMDLSENIEYFDNALREVASSSKFICVGLGEDICDKRIKNGLHGLSISTKSRISNISYVLPMLNSLLCNAVNKSSVVLLSEFIRGRHSAAMSKPHLLDYKYLPSKIHQIEKLGCDVHIKPYLEEVSTLCTPCGFTKDVQPIFMVPGLKPDGMNSLISKLLHPLFEIRLPEIIDDLQSLAEDAVEEMIKFDMRMFTIITSDWGMALALHMTKYLELKGKVVLLILVDPIPYPPHECANHLLELLNKLMTTLLDSSPEVKKQLSCESSFEKKIELFSNHCKKNKSRTEIRRGFNTLNQRLSSLVDFSLEGKLTSKVYILKPYTCKNNTSRLEQYLHQPLQTILTDDFDTPEMMDNPKTAEIVNSLILFEYRDSNHTEREVIFIGANVASDSKYNSPELIRF